MEFKNLGKRSENDANREDEELLEIAAGELAAENGSGVPGKKGVDAPAAEAAAEAAPPAAGSVEPVAAAEAPAVDGAAASLEEGAGAAKPTDAAVALPEGVVAAEGAEAVPAGTEAAAAPEISPKEPEPEDELDKLARSLSAAAAPGLSPEGRKMAELEGLDDLVASLRGSVSDTAPEGMKPTEEAPAPQAVAPQQPMMVAGGPVAAGGTSPMTTATTLGDLAGQAVATAIATPFLALASAGRHLRDRFSGTKPSLMPGAGSPGLSAAAGAALSPLANSVERITQWKCDRIEDAGRKLEAAAKSLKDTPEFVTWESNLQAAAERKGIAPFQAIQDMATDPDLAGLKVGMDSLWQAHPEKVSAYQAAADEFERNIRNVVREFPNSDGEVQRRVKGAMEKADENSQSLPGFGENMGEYVKSLAERVRELARMIVEFLASLGRKFTGAAPAAEAHAPVAP